jgi:ABC-type branched-subunit amino acid transport system ATPase component
LSAKFTLAIPTPNNMSNIVSALEVNEVSSGYGDSLVLRNVSVHVAPACIVGVLGKNGMGKSTLLKTVMGFLPVKGGRIRLFGEDITGLSPHQIARRGVSYLQQEKALFQDLTVGENLRIGLSDKSTFARGLDHIGGYFPFLPQRLRQKAGTLSGGEQKMLLVARTLMAGPRLIMIDEITEGLQPSIIARLGDILRRESRESNIAVVLVEQNLKFALSVASSFAVLTAGEIVGSGDAAMAGAYDLISNELSI